jgi:hypothetical protein
MPIVTAWPVLPSAGEKRRKKPRRKPSRRQRLGINSLIAAQPNLRGKEKTVESDGPIFKIGDKVVYHNPYRQGCTGEGMVTAVIQPGIEGYSLDDGEYRYEIDTIYVVDQSSSGWVWEGHMKLNKVAISMPISDSPYGTEALHPLDYIGIDTCSAMAVSTEPLDFLYLDKSEEAVRSVELNGVGGNGSIVGGRGPMMVKAVDSNGNEVILIDPAGVYIVSSTVQARLRIFGQQRLKSFGFYLQQNKFGDMEDYLVYKDLRMFKMATVRGILLLKTMKINSEERCHNGLNSAVNGLLENKHKNYCFTFNGKEEGENADDVGVSTLIINEGNLSKLERSRLDHWRMAHRAMPMLRNVEA